MQWIFIEFRRNQQIWTVKSRVAPTKSYSGSSPEIAVLMVKFLIKTVVFLRLSVWKAITATLFPSKIEYRNNEVPQTQWLWFFLSNTLKQLHLPLTHTAPLKSLRDSEYSRLLHPKPLRTLRNINQTITTPLRSVSLPAPHYRGIKGKVNNNKKILRGAISELLFVLPRRKMFPFPSNLLTEIEIHSHSRSFLSFSPISLPRVKNVLEMLRVYPAIWRKM